MDESHHRRLPKDEREQQILDAATRSFAVSGYFGTSTGDVAREAGVSQPRVIQMFGTKEELFVRTHQQAARKTLEAFSAGIDSTGKGDATEMGRQYRDLVMHEHDSLMIMQHAFLAAQVPAIGVEARRAFAEIYALLSGAGLSGEELREFMGRGMLINMLLSMSAPAHAEEMGVTDYLAVVFGE